MRNNTTRKLILTAGLVLILISAAGIFTACDLESPYIEAIRERIQLDLGLGEESTIPTYSVTYNGNGNTGGLVPVDDSTYAQGEVVTVQPTGSMARVGYDFLYWNTQSTGGGTNYTVDDTFVMGTSDVDLYAQWEANEYLVTLNKQSGTGGSDSVTAIFDADLPFAAAPTRTGFTFGGYFSEKGAAGTQYYASDMSSARTWDIASDTTLYAAWGTGSYTVTLDKQNGTGGTDHVTASFGLPMPAATAPARPGFTFDGYYAGSGGTDDQYYTSSMTSAANWNIASDATIYANWEGRTRLSGVAGEETESWGVACDGNGNTYIAGYTDGALDGQTLTGTRDAFVIKYDAAGEKEWTRLSGVSGETTSAESIAVDGSGNIYITGVTGGDLDGETLGSSFGVFVIKYDTNGNKLWTRLAGDMSQAHQIAVDGDGNCYTTGLTYNAFDSQTRTGTTDAFIIKYDSDGTKKWTRLWGIASHESQAYGITVDSGGNTYITGKTTGSGNSITTFVVKYNSSGTKQLDFSFGNGGTDEKTESRRIVLDSSGNIYVSGFTNEGLDGETEIGTYDAFLVKYDSSAVRQWTRLSGVTGISTRSYGVGVDGSGNSFIGGYTSGNLDGKTLTGTIDAFLIEYNSSGTKQGTTLFGVSGGSTLLINLTLDGSGNVISTGSTDGNLDGETATGSKDAFITTNLQVP